MKSRINLSSYLERDEVSIINDEANEQFDQNYSSFVGNTQTTQFLSHQQPIRNNEHVVNPYQPKTNFQNFLLTNNYTSFPSQANLLLNSNSATPQTSTFQSAQSSNAQTAQANTRKKDAFGFKLTIQSLINQSAKILSEIQQTKICIESWYKKHLSTLSEMSKKLEELLVELDSKAKVTGALQQQQAAQNARIESFKLKRQSSNRYPMKNKQESQGLGMLLQKRESEEPEDDVEITEIQPHFNSANDTYGQETANQAFLNKEQLTKDRLEEMSQSVNSIALQLRMGAIDIFKENMQNQLDQYDLYLEYLFKSIKALPENYPSIVCQNTEGSRHQQYAFDTYEEPPAGSCFDQIPLLTHYDKLFLQLNNEYLVLVNYDQDLTDVVEFNLSNLLTLQSDQLNSSYQDNQYTGHGQASDKDTFGKLENQIKSDQASEIAKFTDFYPAQEQQAPNFNSINQRVMNHVVRFKKGFQIGNQHGDRLFLGNDVYSISQGFKYIQTIGYGEMITAYCNYDKRVVLVGQSSFKIGVYRFQDGLYQEFKQIRTYPQFSYSQIISLHKLTERLFLLILGRPKVSIRVVEIDPIKWQQIEAQKIGCYSSQILDIKRVSETKFLAQTQKKAIMIDYTVEGYEKLMKIGEKDAEDEESGDLPSSLLQMCSAELMGQSNATNNNSSYNSLGYQVNNMPPPQHSSNGQFEFSNHYQSVSTNKATPLKLSAFQAQEKSQNIILLPFYDPWDLPYIIGGRMKIYDTRLKAEIGQINGVNPEESISQLGFINNTTILLVSNKQQGLQFYNLDQIQQ